MRRSPIGRLRSVAAAIGRRPGEIVRSVRSPGPPPDDGRTRVLVTGAGGLIGGVVREALSGDHHVRGVDVKAGSGVDWVRDMRRLRSIEPAFVGMDVVVDLAAASSASASWDTIAQNNMPATINAFEAARRAGVRRVVYASSNHAVGMYEHDEPWASVVSGAYGGIDPETFPRLGVDVPVRPDGPYGLGKVFGEAVGRYYADHYGLSVLCVRIGTVNEADRPLGVRHFATLLTHRDLASLVRCCVADTQAVRFGIVYGVSRNTWRLWDIEAGRDLIGFDPRDDAENFRGDQQLAP